MGPTQEYRGCSYSKHRRDTSIHRTPQSPELPSPPRVTSWSSTRGCQVLEPKTPLCPQTWTGRLCRGHGGLLVPSRLFLSFLLAPIASPLRLPDEYSKAWILCSLMNIDAAGCPPWNGQQGWHPRGWHQCGWHRWGCRGIRMPAQEKAAPRAVPSTVQHVQFVFSPQNTHFLPQNAGMEQSHL